MGPVLMCLAVTVSDSHRGLQCGASVDVFSSDRADSHRGLQCGASVEDVFSSDRVRLTPRTAVWGQC